MSTAFDENGPCEALSPADRKKVAKDCKDFYQKWHREADRKRPALHIAQEMKELCMHCVGTRACPQEATGYFKCLKGIRGSGQYNGQLNCDEYIDPLQRCAMPIIDSGIFDKKE